MGDRLSGSIITAAVAVAAISTVFAITQTFAQTPPASGAVPKTPWGEPDLQGIWTDEFDTALQRPAQLANQEFFTEAQRAELDKSRSATLNRFATEREINGAYNRAAFRSTKRTGARTSKIVASQWPASASHRRGSEDGGHGSSVPSRLVAIDWYLQK